MLEECPVLAWAASGGMALTGTDGGLPLMSPAAGFAGLKPAVRELADVTRSTGVEVRADPAELLMGRAALAGLSRHGRRSAGGSARLLRTAGGWCAVNLSRPDDMTAVPAMLGLLGWELAAVAELDQADDAGRAERAWAALERAATGVTAEALADAAQALGVPAAALPPSPVHPSAPAQARRITRIADRRASARLAAAVVVDLSSMWAGPLCARLLGLAGAAVIKVESRDRADGARAGDRRFFDWLHGGHRSVAVDFRAPAGREALAGLLAIADVVIEASRPRALAALGLAPETMRHRDGQVWLSITGYGRAQPDLVAFGDDAAVAGRLVGWADDAEGSAQPVFCADAIADPLTGLAGALAVAHSVAAGGGELIDLPMRAVAGAFAAAPAVDHGPHEIRLDGAATTVHCARLGVEQAVLPPTPPPIGGPAPALGADTEAVLGWLARC
jgi:hypothetical protein